MFVTEGRKA
uniref:Uncharacterized protein n=1 Tax=Anguilla anguilla TaxID=7936 RepID=A0A0E9U7M5_ANGAN